jgi:Rrf2 family protein
MKLSTGVEWALHCCVTLGQTQRPLPAVRLAELHGTPPAYLAKQLQALTRAGVVSSTPGPVGGYRLARPASAITVLDVVQAVDGSEPAYRCTEIRKHGPLALSEEQCRNRCFIARAVASAEEAWRAVLSGLTIADLSAGIDADSGGTALPDLRDWLSSVS